MKTIRLRRWMLCLLLHLVFLPDIAPAQTTRERGLGPYTLVTRRGEITARILRREGDMIWVDRLAQSGNWIETGVAKRDIIEFRAPRPRLFELADQAETPEQIAAAIDQIRRMIAQLRPYRDLPGIPVHDGLLLQAQLNERREFWREALQIYEELLGQTYEMKDRQAIRYRAGLALWQMKNKERALTYLLDDPIPDEDLDLLSLVLYARGDSQASIGNHREAVDTFLRMIVFYPFTQNNEPKALAGIIPSFIAMQDWDAVMKSLEALQRDYAESEESAAAEKIIQQYTQKIEAEKQYQVSQE